MVLARAFLSAIQDTVDGDSRNGAHGVKRYTRRGGAECCLENVILNTACNIKKIEIEKGDQILKAVYRQYNPLTVIAALGPGAGAATARPRPRRGAPSSAPYRRSGAASQTSINAKNRASAIRNRLAIEQCCRRTSLPLFQLGGEAVVDAEAKGVFQRVVGGRARWVEEPRHKVVKLVRVGVVPRRLPRLVLVVRVGALLGQQLCNLQIAVLRRC
mmetsp:Transcript_8106/g.28477  ORF Transcript_8106/g.28477 Transcript_8106/m.28477 type:complete len:215 (-) Transcript_8106:3376-4020(-)